FLLAAMRAIDRVPDDPGAVLGPLYAMGMPLWQPPSPNGWPDTAAAWASPEGMKLRLDVSATIAARVKELINPSELPETLAGGPPPAETLRATAAAESRKQGLALLLIPPKFKWRYPMRVLSRTPSAPRRWVLASGASLFAWAYLPKFACAGGSRDPRLVVIILRGALDGLSAVGPICDPLYASLHGQIALSLTGDHAAIPLDSFFALNPAMPEFARLYREGHAAVIHATATAYRERSHFDGQDVLESGYPGPGAVQSGWLNRAIGALP